jgi:hypothetical protein
MHKAEAQHPSEKELTLYLDNELEGRAFERVSQHLAICAACTETVNQINQASEAFAGFEIQFLRPAVVPAPVEWPDASELVALRQPKTARRTRWLALSSAMAVAAALVIGFVIYWNNAPRWNNTPRLSASALLDRSSIVTLPPQRQLRVRAGSWSAYRPAVLSVAKALNSQGGELKDVQTLFVSANYSWEEPLSARSYSSWRKRLSHKRDEVSLLTGKRQTDSFYLIKTETSDGLLRTAWLTVRRTDLHPVEGSFRFDRQEIVTISDTGIDVPDAAAPTGRSRTPDVAVHRLSASDSLHILAALNRAGVDVGQDIELLDNPAGTKLILRASGIDAASRDRILRELDSYASGMVASGVVQWEARDSGTAGRTFPAIEMSSKGAIPGPMRKRLEETFGGPAQLESTTSRALDLAGDLLANAHALAVLAQRVPTAEEASLNETDRPLMARLRQGYLDSLATRLSELSQALLPILGNEPRDSNAGERASSWQDGAGILLRQAQDLNRDVALLLAGTYTADQGDALLGRIPGTASSLKSVLENERETK